MINTENIKRYVVTGLKKYLAVEVIRSNQNQKPPAYPYLVYTITTLESKNDGTFGEYTDGTDRKAVTQVWSVSALADTEAESIRLASKAKEWLERVGTLYLSEHDVIVQSVTGVTNRDNVLSVEYEYRNGFDVTFWSFSEVGNPTTDTIEIVDINNTEIKPSGDKIEHYNGSYTVTPRVERQTLHTENKIMDDDVTVLQIPYFEVTNTNGTTVIIGGQ